MATAATGSPSVRVLTPAEQSYLTFGTTSSYLIEERQRLRTIRDNLPVIDSSMMAELRTANQLARSLIADLRARQPTFGLPSDLDVRATQTLAFMQYDAGVNAEYIRIYGQQVAQRETAASLSGRTSMVSGPAAAAMNASSVQPPAQSQAESPLQNSRDFLIAAATRLNHEYEAGLEELRRRGAFLEEDLPIQAQLHTETQNQLRQQYRAIEEEMHALNAEDQRPNALLRAAAERDSTVPSLLLQSHEQAVTAAPPAQARAASAAPAPAAGARPEATLGTHRHLPRRAELQRLLQQIEQELQLDVQYYENHIAQIHQKLDDVRSEWHERTCDYDRIRSTYEQQFRQLPSSADSIA